MTETLFRDDAYQRECTARVIRVEDDAVVLDRTVFYPLGGGQPGDTGVLRRADGSEIRVTDTRMDRETGNIRQLCEPDGLGEGEEVTAVIDWEPRYRYMRMHTCLHLLSAVITAPVTGGNIGDGYGRLDFDLPDSPDAGEVEKRLNDLIKEDRAVGYEWITDDELDAQPELIKTMSVKPPRGVGRVRLVKVPGVDLQPCGGTHVAHTGEIGAVRVAKIDKKGKANRRVRLELLE
ncbi:MAG: alanyl-tRNA editing protein [Gammaproteobacteria bacterium]|nr:alanyl-tRNA editing protein [Gammaproteobacteria bacterium]